MILDEIKKKTIHSYPETIWHYIQNKKQQQEKNLYHNTCNGKYLVEKKNYTFSSDHILAMFFVV